MIVTETYSTAPMTPAELATIAPDMCERCDEHIAVTFLGDQLVCGTCYVLAQPEPPMGVSAITGEPCC